MEIAAFINRLPEVLGHHGIDPEDEAPELFALVEAFETIARDVVTDQTSADLEDTVTVEYSNDTESEPATLGMDRRVGVYDESGPRGALTLFFDLELKPEPGFALPASASFYGRGGDRSEGEYGDAPTALAAFRSFAESKLRHIIVASWRAEVEDEREDRTAVDD